MLGDPDATGPTPKLDRPPLRKGDSLGRYVIISVLGSGGMGVVYGAYDPDLDRRVAIKLLRIGDGSRTDTYGRGRLIREAQSLAKLAHPNVITVHDVGEHDGRVFVAMEFIGGPTLKTWLDARPRGPQEVLDVMRRAGRGLVAAHAKGMVHRDFKPDNVMLELDAGGVRPERVLVMDFGLASPAGSKGSGSPDLDLDTSGGSLSSMEKVANLTRTGAVMGTPAYMAPEQHAGAATDARTDQFSFCVTLYEALYGRRPFEGDSLPVLTANTMRGKVLPPPPKSGVPRWLFDVVRRGLSVKPSARWGSMGELLDALDRDPTRARRRVVALAAVGGLFGLGYLGFDLAEKRRLSECEATAATIDDVYRPDVAQRIEEAFSATKLDFAEDTWARLEPLLKARADEWRDARYEACADQQLAANLRDAQDDCFELNRQAFIDELDDLANADKNRVSTALGRSLQRVPLRCLDENWLRHRPPLPQDPEARAEVFAIRRDLARAATLRGSGRYEEAMSLSDDALARAQQREQTSLIAAGHLSRARTLSALGRSADAETAYEEAFFVARANDYVETARGAAHQLMHLTAQERNDLRNARRWARHARTLPTDDSGPLDEADYAINLARIEFVAGHYAEAIEHFETAEKIYVEHLSLGSPQALSAIQGKASAYAEFGKHEEAIEAIEATLATSESVFGARSPSAAEAHNTLGAALINQHRFDEARTHLETAVEIYETNGLDGLLGSPLDNLVTVAIASRDTDNALKLSERAVAFRKRTTPEGHPTVGNALFNYAQVLGDVGRYDESIAAYTEALGIYERSLGKAHPRVADTLYNVAIAVDEAGEHERALQMYQRSLEIRRDSLSPDHPHLVWSALGIANVAIQLERFGLARDALEPFVERAGTDEKMDPVLRALVLGLSASTLHELGEPASAIPRFERAVELADHPRQAPTNRAELSFGLARALWDADVDRPRAMELAEHAREQLAKLTAPGDPRRDEVETWLKEHRP